MVMEKYAVISGDLIGYTGLSPQGRDFIESELSELLQDLQSNLIRYGRLIKGDYLEVICQNPAQALRIALLIKCKIKGAEFTKNHFEDSQRSKYFLEHGIRLAIGYGKLDAINIQNGRIDGEAIFLSGRMISSQKTYDKERVVIKNTLFFSSENEPLNHQLTTIFELIDFIIANATARQCQIIFHKLRGESEQVIAARYGISQPAINRHSTRGGWNALETAVLYYENLFK
jgi:hypothetical protein